MIEINVVSVLGTKKTFPVQHLVNKVVLLMMLDSFNTVQSVELNAVAAHLLFFSLSFSPTKYNILHLLH